MAAAPPEPRIASGPGSGTLLNTERWSKTRKSPTAPFSMVVMFPKPIESIVSPGPASMRMYALRKSMPAVQSLPTMDSRVPGWATPLMYSVWSVTGKGFVGEGVAD